LSRIIGQRCDVRESRPVEIRLERAASNYRDGELTAFEEVARYETPELAYLVEVERFTAKESSASLPR
jgi:hypothetical protein